MTWLGDAPVSVIIPHHGDPALALALIDDLRGQTGGLVREIIVSDDRSPLPFPDTPGVRVVRRETNGGFGAAVNSGCAVATGEYLLLLNSDIRIGPDFLTSLMTASRPWMPAITGPRYADSWSPSHGPAGRFPTPFNTAVARLRAFRRLKDQAWAARLAGLDLAAQPRKTVRVDWLVGAVLFLPRAEFERVGGFDEGYHMFSEEVDLQRRLHRLGVPTVFVGDVRADHIGGASTSQPQQLDWRMRSVERYFTVWGGLGRYRIASSLAHFANFGWDVAARLMGRKAEPVAELRKWLRLTWRPGR